jgi:hypothetical protein
MTYVGELLNAFIIIREDSERFSHDLKVCQHITQKGFQGHPHWQGRRLVGEHNFGLVHVRITCVVCELAVIDSQYARGLVPEDCS